MKQTLLNLIIKIKPIFFMIAITAFVCAHLTLLEFFLYNASDYSKKFGLILLEMGVSFYNQSPFSSVIILLSILGYFIFVKEKLQSAIHAYLHFYFLMNSISVQFFKNFECCSVCQ